ncbi:putative Type 1 protein phosphatase inhibitor [Helianthus annuus]|uniref:Type 1 protein phosphatase inhibitor n=1 Tax=Helianthus annuus TaxID=4232 RepID=A0A9K3NMR4_HELAN|nr:protein phosphatase 1 regulatory subunit INH3 [Helianthus annuus]KAF5804938.1 putative Type 1 protein phosphatase inhibitor [Helianthus annuus]KAJ0569490.1 putative Type 1 protein phosphatase inhibitor [Helianthus annuus]KAJ0583800.1 putative Type 1 protein phosphatase inhibitor [Helianthus annuus]KAJ0746859.1 putative Type 1 protein phosphatase inhibitor [Helianthus annuus]KAJ0918033.1 putative Type 1 protein phosphatase inhibitor [Helianthus annuus]
MSRPTRQSATTSSTTTTATTTITLEPPAPSQTTTLTLTLNPRKKKVTWKEGTVDNEFMQKKSSKKCCIFHKEKPFDEDTSDDEDCHDHDHDHDCGGSKKEDDGASTS